MKEFSFYILPIEKTAEVNSSTELIYFIYRNSKGIANLSNRIKLHFDNYADGISKKTAIEIENECSIFANKLIESGTVIEIVSKADAYLAAIEYTIDVLKKVNCPTINETAIADYINEKGYCNVAILQNLDMKVLPQNYVVWTEKIGRYSVVMVFSEFEKDYKKLYLYE
jgi:hypothetical protein